MQELLLLVTNFCTIVNVFSEANMLSAWYFRLRIHFPLKGDVGVMNASGYIFRYASNTYTMDGWYHVGVKWHPSASRIVCVREGELLHVEGKMVEAPDGTHSHEAYGIILLQTPLKRDSVVYTFALSENQ